MARSLVQETLPHHRDYKAEKHAKQNARFREARPPRFAYALAYPALLTWHTLPARARSMPKRR
jgi:hypothetical protein